MGIALRSTVYYEQIGIKKENEFTFLLSNACAQSNSKMCSLINAEIDERMWNGFASKDRGENS